MSKEVSLKTGAYGFRELAMAIKWSSEARVDLLTIDGASGGTGMSPWRMMQGGVFLLLFAINGSSMCSKLATRRMGS